MWLGVEKFEEGCAGKLAHGRRPHRIGGKFITLANRKAEEIAGDGEAQHMAVAVRQQLVDADGSGRDVEDIVGGFVLLEDQLARREIERARQPPEGIDLVRLQGTAGAQGTNGT